MKLRVSDNSVRLRLGRSDVDQLAATGIVEAALRFGPDSALIYRLITDTQAPFPRASFADGVMEISIPPSFGEDVYAVLETGTGQPLTILIEKDFQCLHRDEEPDSYPNPLQ